MEEEKKIEQSNEQRPSFKPFDKVLVRGSISNKWTCAIFSHFDPTPAHKYVANSLYWTECIPYNGSTAHLVGTTDDYKED